MLFAPLSTRHVSVFPPRQRSGSVTSTLSRHTVESEPQTRKRSPSKHHNNDNKNNLRHTYLNHLESPARAQARFRANLILWYARQTIARSTAMTIGRLDRAPCVMDVVLNLKVEYDDDTLIELLQRYRYSQLKHTKVVHAFKDQRSVDTYWADQAAVWGGMRTIEEGKSTRFPDSDERSTASWTAAPN
ncbi:hypothetical protein D9615_000621 [Tricholomella constricta]|uniref:Uncharacterized protein n=1 Tax=Tricholomella constricta TaxID=117010 RepID=A0A8H5HQW8_9AGAR|nr:hypothetical protein D9615_000621 [Tricholomella constricta]